MSRRAIVAIGGNLGDREGTIARAVSAIDALEGVRVVAASRVYETPALTLAGVDETEPAYLNAAVRLEIADRIQPRALLHELRAIEDAAGRERELRWGNRTLDLDIIDIAGVSMREHDLTIPHPRAGKRAFVLAPWLDVEPAATLDGESVAALRGRARDRFEAVGQIVLLGESRFTDAEAPSGDPVSGRQFAVERFTSGVVDVDGADGSGASGARDTSGRDAQ